MTRSSSQVLPMLILWNYFSFFSTLIPYFQSFQDSSSLAGYLELVSSSPPMIIIPSVTTNNTNSSNKKNQHSLRHQEKDENSTNKKVVSLTKEQRRENLELLWSASGRRYYGDSSGIMVDGSSSNHHHQQQQFQSIRLVISHCLHDLYWLTNFTQGYNIYNIHNKSIHNNDDGGGIISPHITEITIISKCGKSVVGAPPMSNVIRLPNLGRCDHSYAYYLSQHIEREEEMNGSNNGSNNGNNSNENENNEEAIVFLKDDHDTSSIHQPGVYRTLSDMLQIASQKQTGFACGMRLTNASSYARSLSAYHQTIDLYKFKLHTYQSQKHKRYDTIVDDHTNKTTHDSSSLVLSSSSSDTSVISAATTAPFESEYKNLGEWVESILPSDSTTTVLPFPLTEVCYGGVFVTTRTNILKTTSRTKRIQQQQELDTNTNHLPPLSSPSLWKQLQLSLERGNNIEEGHFMERIWAGLLSTPITKLEMMDLLQYSNTVINVKESIMGALAVALPESPKKKKKPEKTKEEEKNNKKEK